MSQRSTSILLTSGESKQTLAVARSLSKEGFDVAVAGSSRFSQSFYSKYCSGTYKYSDPYKDQDDFVSDMMSITNDGLFDILLPVQAATTVPIAKCQEEFDSVKIPLGSYKNVELAHDKEKTFEHARKCGVPIPATFCPDTTEELETIADQIEYPAVIKLRKTAAAMGLQYVTSREELLTNYGEEGPETLSIDYSNPLIQEYVSGNIHDVCVLYQNGELKKALTQKRIKMFPESGGAGVINVTTDRPDLVRYAHELLSPLNWHGIAQIEFMSGGELDEPKLIEINPKVWGTIELSIAAGMNFPKYLCDIATEQGIQGKEMGYESDLHFIWWESGLIGNVFQSEETIQSIRDIHKTRKKNYCANIDTGDPRPHLVRFPQIAIQGARFLIKGGR